MFRFVKQRSRIFLERNPAVSIIICKEFTLGDPLSPRAFARREGCRRTEKGPIQI